MEWWFGFEEHRLGSMLGHRESSHTFIKSLLGICMINKGQS